jgi:hypothetical protein
MSKGERKMRKSEIRPEGMTEEHFEYLDNLRESGRTNMFGAALYLTDEMDVPKLNARKFLAHWMETFQERVESNNGE